MATPASGSSSEVDESFSTTSSSSSFSLTIPQVLMNEPPPMEPKVEHPEDPFDDAPSDLNPDQPAPPRPTLGPWFTFDDIPLSKWRSRMLEFNAWLDTQMTIPYTLLKKVLDEFSSRFTGSLREWFFNGNYQLIFQQRKQEFFDRKCCSLKFRDLERHYQRMNHLYHEIGGFKDDNLKLTFIASLPQLIEPEFTLTAVDRMCEQQRLFKKIAKDTPHPQMPQGLSSQERDMWIYRKIIELYPQVLPHPNDFTAPVPWKLFPTVNESFPHIDNELSCPPCLGHCSEVHNRTATQAIHGDNRPFEVFRTLNQHNR
ncbi:hypothetical protein JCGZ_24158 [Jatropha curcas]|uniref:Uncharacterized protein n=1 Tax=Jatropha curcas TaxID=180498 RepID=A0A067K0A6_JATCU|nr:hypothetical protein JCGZ_24158 [Jatropha curcas]